MRILKLSDLFTLSNSDGESSVDDDKSDLLQRMDNMCVHCISSISSHVSNTTLTREGCRMG